MKSTPMSSVRKTKAFPLKAEKKTANRSRRNRPATAKKAEEKLLLRLPLPPSKLRQTSPLKNLCPKLL